MNLFIIMWIECEISHLRSHNEGTSGIYKKKKKIQNLIEITEVNSHFSISMANIQING